MQFDVNTGQWFGQPGFGFNLPSPDLGAPYYHDEHLCSVICNILRPVVPPGATSIIFDAVDCERLMRYLRKRVMWLTIVNRRFHQLNRARRNPGRTGRIPGGAPMFVSPLLIPPLMSPIHPYDVYPGGIPPDTYVPCWTVWDAESRDIMDWLSQYDTGVRGPCTIDGLIRACQSAPWFYNFWSCVFTEGPEYVGPGPVHLPPPAGVAPSDGHIPYNPLGTPMIMDPDIWPCLPDIVSPTPQPRVMP